MPLLVIIGVILIYNYDEKFNEIGPQVFEILDQQSFREISLDPMLQRH
jgi:hypothetical protein